MRTRRESARAGQAGAGCEFIRRDGTGLAGADTFVVVESNMLRTFALPRPVFPGVGPRSGLYNAGAERVSVFVDRVVHFDVVAGGYMVSKTRHNASDPH